MAERTAAATPVPVLRPLRPDERADFTWMVMETLRQGDLAMAAVMRSPFLAWWARRVMHFSFHRRSRALLLEINGRAAGFLVLRRARQTLHIDALGVLEPFRRQGWGRWLLEQAAQEARSLGLTRLELHVSSGNRPALALYAGAGFLPVPRTWSGLQLERTLPQEEP